MATEIPYLPDALADFPAGVVTVILQDLGGGQLSDERIFDAVVEQLRAKAQAFLQQFPRARGQIDADDLVNEFLRRLIENLSPYDLVDRRHFFALACQNFRWILLSLVRRQANTEVRDGIHVAVEAGPATWVAGRDDIARAFQMIEELPPDTREIVDLRLLGLNFQQIATQLDMPLATVHHRYQAATAQIREVLDE